MLCRELLLPLFPVQRGRSRGEGRKTNAGQVGNLRGGWLPPPVHREGGRGRLPIGRRVPTCPTKSRPPTDARSVFHGISRAEGPFKQTTKGDGLSHWSLLDCLLRALAGAVAEFTDIHTGEGGGAGAADQQGQGE